MIDGRTVTHSNFFRGFLTPAPTFLPLLPAVPSTDRGGPDCRGKEHRDRPQDGRIDENGQRENPL